MWYTANDGLDVANAAKDDGALAFLGGFGCVRLLEYAIGLGQSADGGSNHGEGLGLIELAGNDEVGVVRLVILFVEDGQIFHGNSLNIGAIADDGFAVVVEVVR